MKISIDKITIPGTRRGIDAGKVRELAESIRRIGLLHPVTVTRDHRLVAGAHRLEACRVAGMSEIHCCFVDGDLLHIELAEIDENLIRNELDPISIGELAIRRDEILESLGLRAIAGNNQHSARGGETVSPPQTTVSIAREIGMGERTLQHNKQLARDLVPEAKEVVRSADVPKRDALKIARMEPERQKAVVGKIASGEAKSLVDAKRLLARENVHETAPFPAGIKYRVLYADPPWSYGNQLGDGYGAAGNHYPTMSVDELCALPVTDMAEKNAVLFLWTTSPLLEECFAVIRAWGFRYKTSFVWDKIRHNMGHYNSVRHEFLLICTKGSCMPDVPKLFDSVVSVERTEKHSEKPEIFREMIDTLYTSGRKLELFARKTAPGWDAWGNQS
ncbi:MAG: MT-A70 family methyltransferase [Planctomycetaceae bacterium]|nr:MT-A70 family methyltransferase [Planctomycetaceae bacterium]